MALYKLYYNYDIFRKKKNSNLVAIIIEYKEAINNNNRTEKKVQRRVIKAITKTFNSLFLHFHFVNLLLIA